MFKKGIILAFSGIFACMNLLAEFSDSLIVLDEVVAKGVKFEGFSVGAKVYGFDSVTIQNFSSNSLADLLLQHSQVSLTTYGPGGMANVSMRGGTSDHTTIIWNGFNLHPPMSGNINFSALPVGFVDQVYIQPGGSSTMYGSGASTGIIYLCDELKNNSSNGSMNLEKGSFNTYNSMAKVSFGAGRFASAFKAGYQASENNFPYKNPLKAGIPTDTLRNAGYQSKMIAQQNSLLIGRRSKLESDFWYVALNKDIPSLMSDYEPGKGNQEDENLRMALNFSSLGTNWYFKYRTGLFYDKIKYTANEEISGEVSINQSYSYINEAEGKYAFTSRNKLFFGINTTYEKAVTSNYISDTGRIRTSFFGRYFLSMFSGRFDLSTEARQEIVGNELIPFIFSVGAKTTINQYLTLKATIAKHYSLPDMNDIFWKEDAFARGNSNLDPEYGWNYELGLLHKTKSKSFELSNELTGFQSSIHDLIVWLPGSGGKWEPRNLNYSVSRGIEFMGKITARFQKSSLSMDYKYSYINAQVFNRDSVTKETNVSKRTYVPKHKASVSLNYQYRNLTINYSQIYVGQRFYDYNHFLEAYSLGEISINYLLKTKSVSFNPFLKIRNIFNTSYQVMTAYAQPPRAYYIGLNISF